MSQELCAQQFARVTQQTQPRISSPSLISALRRKNPTYKCFCSPVLNITLFPVCVTKHTDVTEMNGPQTQRNDYSVGVMQARGTKNGLRLNKIRNTTHEIYDAAVVAGPKKCSFSTLWQTTKICCRCCKLPSCTTFYPYISTFSKQEVYWLVIWYVINFQQKCFGSDALLDVIVFNLFVLLNWLPRAF